MHIRVYNETQHAACATCQRIRAVIVWGNVLLLAVLIVVACTCVVETAVLWH